jgi:hypothetical protein
MIEVLQRDRDFFELTREEYLALRRRRKAEEMHLLKTAKRNLPKLKALLKEVSSPGVCEHVIYRYYHHCFKDPLKVRSRLLPRTLEIVEALQALAPHLRLNADFQVIISHGFERPRTERMLVEAFFHARHMLAMACKYAEELSEPPQVVPYGYATFLYLYNLR